MSKWRGLRGLGERSDIQLRDTAPAEGEALAQDTAVEAPEAAEAESEPTPDEPASPTPEWLAALYDDERSPMERLRQSLQEDRTVGAALDGAACAAIATFLNDFFAEGLLEWAMVHTDVGATARKKNAWSRGACCDGRR